MRQWTWAFSSLPLSWTLAIGLTLILITYFRSEIRASRNSTFSPWTYLALLPFVVLFIGRLPLAQIGVDVFSYHLGNAERGLAGMPFRPGDYDGVYLNPLPDMVNGIVRKLFGIRVGTLTNLLVLFATAGALERILSHYVHSPLRRAGAIFLCLTTEYQLIEIHGYYIDTFGLPALLEALELVCFRASILRQPRSLAYLGFLLGLSVAMKLSNAAFAFPLAVIALLSLRHNRVVRCAAILVAGSVFCLLPYHAACWWQTANPVYPYFNNIFQSTSTSPIENLCEKFLYKGFFEWASWPLILGFKPGRGGELIHYAGHLTLGFLISLLVLANKERGTLKKVAGVFILGTLLWSRWGGNLRYALFLEVLGATLTIALAARLRIFAYSLGLILVLTLQGAVSIFAAYEIVGPFHDSPSGLWAENWKQQSYWLFRDRDFTRWASSNTRALLKSVHGWVGADFHTIGIMEWLAPNASLVNLIRSPPSAEHNPRLARSLLALENESTYSLCSPGRIEECEAILMRHNWLVRERKFVALPALTNEMHPFALLRITRDSRLALAPYRAGPKQNSALLRSSLHAKISLNKAASQFSEGSNFAQLDILNTGRNAWSSDGDMPIRLGFRWRNELRSIKEFRVFLPGTIDPGVGVSLEIAFPNEFLDAHGILEINLLQEHAFWFDETVVPPILMQLPISSVPAG